MAKVNLSQAAKLTGKNRTTIWRHLHSGKLSIERDRDGLPFVDTSELIRVYGELEPIATGGTKKKPHQATPSYEDLIRVVELLRKEQHDMKEQIADLTNRLPFIPINEKVEDRLKSKNEETRKIKPEDDPEWPVEITTMADILLRSKIKDKYK